MSLPSIFPSASRIFSKPTARPTSPSPSISLLATARIACPPVAQAFSTLSIGLASSPGVMARRPERSPCSLSVRLQTAPTVATSTADASAFTDEQVSSAACRRISGTVIPRSFPNFDCW